MTPRQLVRLHEAACLLRAYPKSAAELARARRVLAGFPLRKDLVRHAESLADSGIAGTPIRYRFFWPMARWLADRYPSLLTLDWSEDEFAERLTAILPTLVTYPEGEALRRRALPARSAIARLCGSGEAEGTFLVRRIAALPADDAMREAIHDALDVAYRLAPSSDGPSRTHAFLEGAPFAFRQGPPERGRPDLAEALRVPPRSVRPLPRAMGSRIVDLAREAMVTRSRDLDAFAAGDARDVVLVDDGDGLAFAMIGVVPARRLFLPAVYGALTLRNGVPIGYVQLDVLFGNAEVSYNTFATFRHGEAGFVFCRLLSAVRHLFGVRSFSIEPYQLGRGNNEGIESGAWWFYARFGFRPRDHGVQRLANLELGKRARNPRYRSSRRTLLRLSESHVFWPRSAVKDAILTPTAAIGFALARKLSRATGADREAGVDACAERVGARLGVRNLHGFSADERLWWRRFAPLIDALPGTERWTSGERKALVRVVRAKGGRRESDYLRQFNAHPRLARAILDLADRARVLG